MTTRLAAPAMALLLAVGCAGGGKPMPKTYPVTGKVVQADGSPLAGGLIHFKPETNAEVTTTGVIQSDGSFTLRTTLDTQQVPGAVEGPHTVTILPPLGQDQHAARGMAPQPIQLRETYTVKAEGANNFTITLPR
jgi:hypothetical protein